MQLSDFYGHPVAGLENDLLRLEVLRDAGPRIVRLVIKALGVNILAESPNYQWQTRWGMYHLWGGHRLWLAPESSTEADVPDDAPVKVEIDGLHMRIAQEQADMVGMRKWMDIRLDGTAARVDILHGARNEGQKTAPRAPWAITQLVFGGRVALPYRFPVGGENRPDRKVMFWPCNRVDDPRLVMGEEIIQIEGRVERDLIAKVGVYNPTGTLLYITPAWSFEKEYLVEEDGELADGGCNSEVYLNDQYVELESLGKLRLFKPGDAMEWRESWEIRLPE